jgi:hypothetical protein
MSETGKTSYDKSAKLYLPVGEVKIVVIWKQKRLVLCVSDNNELTHLLGDELAVTHAPADTRQHSIKCDDTLNTEDDLFYSFLITYLWHESVLQFIFVKHEIHSAYLLTP